MINKKLLVFFWALEVITSMHKLQGVAFDPSTFNSL